MTSQEFDQIKSYSTLLVSEIHKLIFGEVGEMVYNRIKDVLKLSEELEHKIMGIERKRAINAPIELRRIA